MNPSISSRTLFSIQHVQTAAFLARQAAVLETEHDGTYHAERLYQHRGYVTGAIITATAFLEAYVNELCSDACEPNGGHLQYLEPAKRQMIAAIWEHGVLRRAGFSIRQKYDILLVLVGPKHLDWGRPPCQDVALLVQLRNYLVHYEPKWEQHGTTPGPQSADFSKLAHGLGGRFAINPMTGDSNPFLPDKCLGHGCAAWAVRSAIAFTDLFSTELGMVKPRYEHVRHNLAV